ncbi:MAG: T9SS type A sorting domain-containing protein, partial [Bacteroidales bacterium]
EEPQEMTTIYYPGPQDVEAGGAVLSLTAFSQLPCTENITDDMLLTIWPLPEVTFETMPDFCHNSPPYQLIEGGPEGGTYAGPGVADGWFYPETAGIGTHQLSYTFRDENGCENVAWQEVFVDDCTGISPAADGDGVSIYPNPSGGVFIILPAPESFGAEVVIEVYDSKGNIIYRAMEQDGAEEVAVDLSGKTSGVYYLKLIAGERVITEKLVLRK